jgi:hypothetical protein
MVNVSAALGATRGAAWDTRAVPISGARATTAASAIIGTRLTRKRVIKNSFIIPPFVIWQDTIIISIAVRTVNPKSALNGLHTAYLDKISAFIPHSTLVEVSFYLLDTQEIVCQSHFFNGYSYFLRLYTHKHGDIFLVYV